MNPLRSVVARLTGSDRRWLAAYSRALQASYPRIVEEMLVYGSKARGSAGPESDLDVLLILGDGSGSHKRSVRRLGYRLGVTSDTVPSILAYTRAEWDVRRRLESSFYKVVERDAVRVAVD